MGFGKKEISPVLKLARGKASTVSGTAEVKIKIPADGRYVKGGQGWFETPHLDDYFMIYITDEDNVLGYGAGTVIGSYTDDEVDAANKGVFIPNGLGHLDIDTIGSFGNAPGGFYLKVVGVKGDATVDTLRCNIIWGKKE